MRIRIPRDLFAFATSSAYSDLHVAILSVFGRAVKSLEGQLTPGDVRQRLADEGWIGDIDEASLALRLSEFQRWGLLHSAQGG